METTYTLAKTILKPWLATWFKWHIEGIENIPGSGPALVAINHISYLDPLASAFILDRAKRIPRFLAKSELFEDKKVGWVLRGAKQIEVKRGTRDAPMALDNAVAALKSGEAVVVFPEGTITTDPALHPMEAKTGVARLSLLAQVPIVPVALWGSANIWPKGYAKNFRFGQQILARVGEPISVTGDPGSREDWQTLSKEVMARISVLLASIRPAVPDRRKPKKAT